VSKHKILIISDNADVRNNLSEEFQNRKFETCVSDSGRHAFEMIQSKSVDLVISDSQDSLLGSKKVELEGNLPMIMFISTPPSLFSPLVAKAALTGNSANGANASDMLIISVMKAQTLREDRWKLSLEGCLGPSLQVTCEIPGDATPYSGELLNIGHGGLALSTLQRFSRIDEKVKFTVKDSTGQKMLLEGQLSIRWSRFLDDNHKTIGYGGQFTAIKESFLVEIIESLKACYAPKILKDKKSA
jgi:hypothetical protein